MLKIRRPLGRLIFNMGITIPGKTVFLIETAPRLLVVGKLSFRRLSMSKYVCEYDIPLNGVFRCSSRARCGSLPSSNIFHIIFFTVCTNLWPMDCGYRGLLMMRENPPNPQSRANSSNTALPNGILSPIKLSRIPWWANIGFRTLTMPVVVLLDSWWTLGYLE